MNYKTEVKYPHPDKPKKNGFCTAEIEVEGKSMISSLPNGVTAIDIDIAGKRYPINLRQTNKNGHWLSQGEEKNGYELSQVLLAAGFANGASITLEDLGNGSFRAY